MVIVRRAVGRGVRAAAQHARPAAPPHTTALSPTFETLKQSPSTKTWVLELTNHITTHEHHLGARYGRKQCENSPQKHQKKNCFLLCDFRLLVLGGRDRPIGHVDGEGHEGE